MGRGFKYFLCYSLTYLHKTAYKNILLNSALCLFDGVFCVINSHHMCIQYSLPLINKANCVTLYYICKTMNASMAAEKTSVWLNAGLILYKCALV